MMHAFSSGDFGTNQVLVRELRYDLRFDTAHRFDSNMKSGCIGRIRTFIQGHGYGSIFNEGTSVCVERLSGDIGTFQALITGLPSSSVTT